MISVAEYECYIVIFECFYKVALGCFNSANLGQWILVDQYSFPMLIFVTRLYQLAEALRYYGYTTLLVLANAKRRGLR